MKKLDVTDFLEFSDRAEAESPLIIDGMTLALYGNRIRFKNNSSSESKDYFEIEAINKNSQEAKVNFKFKVGENIYRVERNYKIGKKSGKLTKTTILKNENNEEIKIAENYKEIYKEVKENIFSTFVLGRFHKVCCTSTGKLQPVFKTYWN